MGAAGTNTGTGPDTKGVRDIPDAVGKLTLNAGSDAAVSIRLSGYRRLFSES